MMYRTMAACLLAMAAIAFPAAGDPEKAPSKDVPRERTHREWSGGMADDELREMVSTIMMVRVSRSLELSDEQTVVLVKHMQEMRDSLSKLYAERDTAMKSLRESIEKDGVSDEELNAKLKELESADARRSDAKREAFEKVAAGLTTKQKAKLYITLQEFEGQLRRMVQRAKEMGEDVVREKLQEWDRGDGPPHGLLDRPMVKQFMKDRHPDPSPADGEAAKTPAPDATPK